MLEEGEYDREEHELAISKCILEHLYREGNFEAADALAEELPLAVEESIREPFAEMHQLARALRDRQVEPTVNWVQTHLEKLEGTGERLLLKLHGLAFIEFLRQKIPAKALAYAKKFIAPFTRAFPAEVQTLMGTLAFAYQLEESPYRRLLGEDLWEEAEDALVEAYCSVLGLPKESALNLCVNIGTMAWPRISKVLSLMKQRPGVEWNQQEELPVEIPLPPEARFHSIFVCPVLRQQSTDANPPMLLSCGHVISKEAVQRLSKGGGNVRFKCPYCPAECTASTAQVVYF